MIDKNIYGDDFELEFNKWKYIGKGHHGIVYLMDDGKVIKICNTIKSCRKEEMVILKADGNKYFPKTYECGGNYIIREYVEGISLSDYIKLYGLNEKIAKEVIEMLKEFIRLKFSKIDIRCKDIFVTKHETLKIIDPKGCYSKKVNYPRHLCKGLKKLGALDEFLDVLKREEPKLYKKWYKKIQKYFDKA
ncbi:hypothetical protein CLTEP_27280 [Clostridium tepidiprofundi DSM 19306]|uniref:Protein kinase n=1 Tax=Clostridium tepidiprofundi DSM 19306 TaxID=1121338 RepID=A0A151ANS4_9CLOT|nr:protein kinase [Clostridium tepidiprofundi]KYH29210.1 hypothetical protein CLTEP_27280 [Clostridium tepidiprofundi DSM 19306]